MTWNEFIEYVQSVGNRINESGFKPDIIIAIARGGWIPARFLSDSLHVKNMGSIGIKYEDVSRTNLITYSTPSLPQNCKKILLVEDMLESGNSIKWANEYYTNLGYEVMTACLFIIDETKFIPDFYLAVTDKQKFPWEIL